MKFHVKANLCFDLPNRPDKAFEKLKELKNEDPMDILRGKADVVAHSDFSAGFGCFEE